EIVRHARPGSDAPGRDGSPDTRAAGPGGNTRDRHTVARCRRRRPADRTEAIWAAPGSGRRAEDERRDPEVLQAWDQAAPIFAMVMIWPACRVACSAA